MVKKGLVILFLSVIIAGGAFAQTDFETMGKNTVTVDFGPTVMEAVIGAMVGGTGFGIAAQYERQLVEKFSVAGRLAYRVGDLKLPPEFYIDSSGKEAWTHLDIDMSSFSIEGHVRYYPWGKTFFAVGMLGFANMSVDYSGNMLGKDVKDASKRGEPVDVSINASHNFMELGLKAGWRISLISFGKNGDLVFEPAVGYAYGIGFGDSIGKQLIKQLKDKEDAEIEDKGNFIQLYNEIEEIVFIGGPRITLSLGYRF